MERCVGDVMKTCQAAPCVRQLQYAQYVTVWNTGFPAGTAVHALSEEQTRMAFVDCVLSFSHTARNAHPSRCAHYVPP